MNKHLKIAIVMAPVLALIAYGVTGRLVSSKLPSGSHQLTKQGECKPLTGSCLLSSEPFQIQLISSVKNDQIQLAVVSNYPLQALSLALADQTQQYQQMPMVKFNDGEYWQVNIPEGIVLDEFNYFRLAMSTGDSQYFVTDEITLKKG